MALFLTISAIVILVLSLAVLVAVFSIKFDENHNADKKSWHYRFYKFITLDQFFLPKTICQYYWNYILYLILLPFTFPILLMGCIFKSIKGEALLNKSLLFWTISFVALLAGGGFLYEMKMSGLQYLWGYLIGLVILTAGAIILFGAVVISELISERRSKISKPKKESLAKLKFKSWKEKNCPMINWK